MRTPDEAYLKRFLHPWNAHDVDSAMALMTDDCVWEVTRGAEPHGTRFEGAQAVRAAIAALFQAMPDIRYELVHGSFGPGLAVVELLVTGARGSFHACDVMTVTDDGKVSSKRSYRKIVE